MMVPGVFTTCITVAEGLLISAAPFTTVGVVGLAQADPNTPPTSVAINIRFIEFIRIPAPKRS